MRLRVTHTCAGCAGGPLPPWGLLSQLCCTGQGRRRTPLPTYPHPGRSPAELLEQGPAGSLLPGVGSWLAGVSPKGGLLARRESRLGLKTVTRVAQARPVRRGGPRGPQVGRQPEALPSLTTPPHPAPPQPSGPAPALQPRPSPPAPPQPLRSPSSDPAPAEPCGGVVCTSASKAQDIKWGSSCKPSDTPPRLVKPSPLNCSRGAAPPGRQQEGPQGQGAPPTPWPSALDRRAASLAVGLGAGPGLRAPPLPSWGRPKARPRAGAAP